jgi:peptide subunit release factor 1 (eRF1)
LLADLDRSESVRAIEAVITEAAKHGRAVVGVRPTLDAVARGAVHRLYLLRDLGRTAGECQPCGTLVAEPDWPCSRCGAVTRSVDLGDALVERVLAAGGDVELVSGDEALDRVGGVAARLRYPLTSP